MRLLDFRLLARVVNRPADCVLSFLQFLMVELETLYFGSLIL